MYTVPCTDPLLRVACVSTTNAESSDRSVCVLANETQKNEFCANLASMGITASSLAKEVCASTNKQEEPE